MKKLSKSLLVGLFFLTSGQFLSAYFGAYEQDLHAAIADSRSIAEKSFDRFERALSKGAHPSLTDATGQNALHKAVKHGRGDMVKRLVAITGPEAFEQKDREGNTVLHLLASKAHLFDEKLLRDILQQLPEKLFVEGNEKKERPLHRAVATGNEKMVELLLEYDKKALGKQDSNGQTPFLASVSFNLNPALVKVLLLAAEAGRIAEDSNGSNALHRAIHAMNEYEKVLNQIQAQGMTADYNELQRFKETIKFLQEQGVPSDVKNAQEKMPAELATGEHTKAFLREIGLLDN